MQKFYINQSVNRTDNGKFVANVHVYGADLNSVYKMERDFDHTTLTYVAFKSLFTALDYIAEEGAELDIATDVGPLIRDVKDESSHGSLIKILRDKLRLHGMTIGNIKKL